MKKGKSITSLQCKVCEEEVHNVGHDTVAVTCASCVSKSMQNTVPLVDEEDDD